MESSWVISEQKALGLKSNKLHKIASENSKKVKDNQVRAKLIIFKYKK